LKRLTAIALLGLCACTVWAQTPSDVPQDHWAYDAVRDLVEKGYLEGYADGRFLGNRTMTRYELATVIKRIIDTLETRLSALESKAPVTQQPPAKEGKPVEPEVTAADLEQIRKLVEEFKPELVVIGTRIDKLEATLEELGLTVGNLEAIVTDPEGAFETLKSDVSKLKKVSVSGYVQARFNLFRNDPDKSTEGSEPTDNFSVRRARLKITGKPSNKTSVVLQLDAGQGAKGDAGPSVTLKDAYLEYAFAGHPMLGPSIAMGQMKWPFGYSVVESSSVRECPERPLIVARLFPGERDRGFMVSYPLIKNMLTFKFGVFNGVETKFKCPNNNKALVGGLRGSAGDFEFGVSGFLGKGVIDDKGVIWKQNEDRKTRYGVDLQYYGINNLSIKGEWFTGKGVDLIGNTHALYDKISGGWAQIAYNFLTNDTFVARWETLSEDPKYTKYGRRSAWNLGVIHYLDDKTRLKVFYQINAEEKEKFNNDSLICEWITTY